MRIIDPSESALTEHYRRRSFNLPYADRICCILCNKMMYYTANAHSVSVRHLVNWKLYKESHKRP